MKSSYLNTKYYSEPVNQEYFDKLFSQSGFILKPFGANLRALRKYSNISQMALIKGLKALTFRVGGTTLIALEGGKCKTISTTYLSALADYFGLTPFDLIVSDYSIFENIPERVRKTFNMKPENLTKFPYTKRKVRAKRKVKK